jgi:hypothetical protein
MSQKKYFEEKNHKISQNTYKIGGYKGSKHLPISISTVVITADASRKLHHIIQLLTHSEYQFFSYLLQLRETMATSGG